MSFPVSGYVMIHCMCIYVAWSCLIFSFSLNICSSVPLYCHSLYVYISGSWSVFLSLSFSLSISISVSLYCHWFYVNKYVSWSAFLSLSVCFVSVSCILSVILRAYGRLLIRISFSLCLWMCVAMSAYFITHCRCIYTSLGPCLSLFLSEYLSHCLAML